MNRLVFDGDADSPRLEICHVTIINDPPASRGSEVKFKV